MSETRYIPYTLTPDDVRSLASIFAECHGIGWTDADEWIKPEYHADFMQMRELILDLYHALEADPPPPNGLMRIVDTPITYADPPYKNDEDWR